MDEKTRGRAKQEIWLFEYMEIKKWVTVDGHDGCYPNTQRENYFANNCI